MACGSEGSSFADFKSSEKRKMKERIEYIDAAKAVGIWMVVMGHSSNTIVSFPRLVSFIYLFHMPLFFLISGFFFKEPETLLGRPGGDKYLLYYVKPYVVASFTTIIPVVICCWIYNLSFVEETSRLLVATCWGTGWSGGGQMFSDLPAIGPIWFLLALFWASLFYAMICRNAYGLNRLIMVIGVFLFGVISSKAVTLPWSLQSGCSAVIYLYMGNVLYKYKDLVSQHIKELSIVSVVILALIVIFCVFRGGIALNASRFGQGLLSVIASIVCCIGLLFVLKRLGLKGGWSGRNTLCLMCGNQLVDYANYFYHAGSFFPQLSNFAFLNFALEFVTCLILTYLGGYCFYKSKLVAH